MDKATLWMPPLYFFILTIPLFSFDNYLIAGRNFSLVLGFINILLFYILISHITRKKNLSLVLAFLFVISLPFIRAGNTIRMESLNLIWILSTIICLEKEKDTLTGILLGLAGLTHPISIFLIPIVFFYKYKSFKAILYIGFTAFIVMLPWIIYILLNFDIFVFQFISQLSRKTAHYDSRSFVYLIKVLGMQYNSKLIFFIFYLLIFFINSIYIIFLKKLP